MKFGLKNWRKSRMKQGHMDTNPPPFTLFYAEFFQFYRIKLAMVFNAIIYDKDKRSN